MHISTTANDINLIFIEHVYSLVKMLKSNFSLANIQIISG